MKSIVIAAVLAAGLAAAGTANAQEALAKSSGCMTCHDVATKKMGPAFKEVSVKFKGKKDTDVVAAIKAAKPHASSKASDDDLKGISAWILTLK